MKSLINLGINNTRLDLFMGITPLGVNIYGLGLLIGDYPQKGFLVLVVVGGW
jgi:hypothetical protein